MKKPPKTALTHVIDASGLWRVHDGSPEKKTAIDKEGNPLENLSHPEAKRAKDYAVTQLKLRMCGIVKMDAQAATVEDATSAPRQDPYLEKVRQASLNAAKAPAQAAQKRHEEKQKIATIKKTLEEVKQAIPALDALDSDGLEIDGDENDIDDASGMEVGDILSGGADEDVEHAREQADKDTAAAEEMGRLLFATETFTKTTPGDAEVEKRWQALTEKERASFRWRSLNETEGSKQPAPPPASRA